jgi:hypothetical protein
MHGSFKRLGEPRKTIYRSWRVGFSLALLVVVALLGLAMAQPNMSSLISDAVQAEFADTYSAPEMARTQIAKPVREIRTVIAD